ncbi:hypothetical protein [Leptolyngbya phage Lbo-JY46]
MSNFRFMNSIEAELCFGENWRNNPIATVDDTTLKRYFLEGEELGPTLESRYIRQTGDRFDDTSRHILKSLVIPSKLKRLGEAYKNLIKKEESSVDITRVSTGDGLNKIHFKWRNGYENWVGVCVSPTGNCQLASIYTLNNLLQYSPNTIDLCRFLLEINKQSSKLLSLFDIQDKYKDVLNNFLIPGEYYSYVSSNGSKMLTGIIRHDNVLKQYNLMYQKKRNDYLKKNPQLLEGLREFIEEGVIKID